MSLFYIKYGCSTYTEHLIIEAKDEDAANEYAYLSAQDCYDEYSYIDYEEDEEFWGDEENVESDIFYDAVEFDPKNKFHMECYAEQHNKPHVI
jgi:hypothetical protein